MSVSLGFSMPSPMGAFPSIFNDSLRATTMRPRSLWGPFQALITEQEAHLENIFIQGSEGRLLPQCVGLLKTSVVDVDNSDIESPSWQRSSNGWTELRTMLRALISS